MIGKLVGHHKVVRKIGEGGMGSVWEGLHEGIGRRASPSRSYALSIPKKPIW